MLDYVNGHPKGREQKGVALLVHGFPDLWCMFLAIYYLFTLIVGRLTPSADGWRYTIPALLDQGLRVVVPDMLGYGGTVGLPCFFGWN